MKKISILLLATFTSYFSYSQYVYTIKADSIKLTNDSCNTELIIENSTRNVPGFLYNKDNGRTEFRRVLNPIGINKYLVGSDTLDLSGIISSIKARDGLLRIGDSLYLGNTTSGTGTHNFTANRYQYLNGKFYSIGGTVNDPVTKPVFRFYNNGDFTAKAENNLTGNVANTNGIRYNSKYGILEVGTSNNFDTTLATTCCGNSLKSAIIINSDVATTIKGHIHGSILSGDSHYLDSTGVIEWSGVFGEAHNIKGTINKSLVVGQEQRINSLVNSSIIAGFQNTINKPLWQSFLNGLYNTLADTCYYVTVNGVSNTLGGVGQVVFGTGNINRTPFGITMGNKNVDFSTLPYTGANGRLSLQSINNLQNYPLFVIANSYANESNISIKSNAITTLFNGRTQINTTGFNTNLTQTDVTPKAALEVVSTNSGVLLPQLTTIQRNAIAAGDLYNGLLLYNTDLNKFQFYKGNIWISIGDSLSGNTGWALAGNSGTTTSNFLGTTDSVALRFKVNNIPYGFMDADVTALSNTALGYKSLLSNTTGSYNTAFGSSTLISNTTGTQNTAFGSTALNSITDGSYNTAIGVSSLRYTTNGYNNTAIGTNSLAYNTTGFYNTAVGGTSLFANINGSNNTAFGYWSLRFNTSGSENMAIGTTSLRQNTVGNRNVAVGREAIRNDSSGSNNVGVGFQVAYSNFNGSGNVFLGYQSGYYETGSNKLYVSNSATTTPLIYGNFSNPALVINGGASADTAKAVLSVNSTTKGVLLTRMTSAQRTAITSPTKGLLIFDNDSSSLFQFSGSTWQNLYNIGASSLIIQEDASALTARPAVNFNYGVKATDNSGSLRTDVDVNLTSGESFLGSDVAMTAASTFYDGGSISLTAGTWMVMSTGTIESTANNAMRVTGKMWDGTTVYAASEGSVGAMGASTNGYVTMSTSSIITLSSTTTVKLSYTSTLASCVLKATPADNNTGTTGKASSIRAIRIK